MTEPQNLPHSETVGSAGKRPVRRGTVFRALTGRSPPADDRESEYSAAVLATEPAGPNPPTTPEHASEPLSLAVTIVSTGVPQCVLWNSTRVPKLLSILPNAGNAATVFVGGRFVSATGGGLPVLKTQSVPTQLSGVALGQLYVCGTAGDTVFLFGS
jgi:hypothetical protein